MKLTKPLNILVKRRGAIGDVIMTTGVVRELKKRYADTADIYVATDCIEVYKNNPHVKAVVPFDGVTDTQFDVIYNLDDAYENNRDIHYVDSYFYRVFGNSDNMNKEVELFASAEDEKIVDAIINDIDGDYIVVHMRNWHWGAKNISMDVWFELFIKLFEEKPELKVITVGGPTDHSVEHPNFIDLRGNGVLNSQQMMLLCDQAQCFIGIDSGPMQCAAASMTKIVALLTHLAPERILPHRAWVMGYKAVGITTNEDCKGCNDRQQMPVRQIVCEKGNYPCTNNFDVQKIADEILATL
jgi:ADP-heptose:LPS heptosyltransferase